MIANTATISIIADGVPASDAAEFLAALAENRRPVLTPAQYDAVDEAQANGRLRVVNALDGSVVLTREELDRLETLAARGMPVSDGTECTGKRPVYALTPEMLEAVRQGEAALSLQPCKCLGYYTCTRCKGLRFLRDAFNLAG